MRSLAGFADADLRIFDRPPLGTDLHDIYLIGICGTGMGSLAGLLRQAGFSVRGSDSGVYPPMSTFLQKHGIQVYAGYCEQNLSPKPDLVITGNVCAPTHVEATVAREQCIPQLSFPEAIHHFFLKDRRNLVIAGTHGKTTTAAMLVHVLRSASRDPGFLVGGVLQGLDQSFSIGTDSQFVIEGDEYDSAYFDKRPKFIHYAPKVAIITSLEFDHADIYDSYEEYREAFQAFTNLIPADGLLVVSGEDCNISDLGLPSASVLTYGLGGDYDVSAEILHTSEDGIRFNLFYQGNEIGETMLSMNGEHNLRNALAVSAVALNEGLSAGEITQGLQSFPGVKRRQEILGEPGGVLIIDDFAHHPTAVRATIQAMRERWPHRRLLAVFEPRSNSSRTKVFEDAYGRAFEGASKAYLCAPPFRHNDLREQFLDLSSVLHHVRELGTEAERYESTSHLLEDLVRDATSGDIILIMSNGGFDGLHQNLLDQLKINSSK